jgi:hypothetical protein
MKIVNRNAKANLILSRFVFCVMIIFLYSCGNDGSGDDSSGTGSVSFGLALQDSGTIRALNNRQLEENNSQFECQTADYEIATIEAQVVDENENLLAEGAFDCDDRRGDISNVEAGDNRKAKVFAKDSDGVTIFAGESDEPFSVVGGEVTDAGLITLLPVDDALPPFPPEGVTATPGIGQITLNWLPVADATTYNVYFAGSAGVSKTNFEDVIPDVVTTSFTHSNLPGGDTFFYVVTAQNDIGESDESTEVSATVLSVNARLVDEFIGTGFGSDPWTGLFNTGFDGSGGGTFQDIATSDGILENGTLTYNMNVDGSLTSTLSTGTEFTGIVNPANNILAVADTDFSDEFIEMDVAIKNSTGLTNAILNGEYIGVRISNFRSTALTSTIFDGNGNGTFQFLAASNGFFDTGTFTYSVSPDNGGITIFLPGGAVASQGIVSGEGNVVSIVDTNASDDDEISMAVLIKVGSGLSNASLNGDYVGVSFGYFIGEGFNEETATMNISVDGAGNMVVETLSNSSGTVGTFNATYNVNPNGRITIDLPNEETFEGIVIGEGDILNFVNTDPSDQFIEMGVAIKKTQ